MPRKKASKEVVVRQTATCKALPMFTEADRLAGEQRLASCICNRNNTTVRCTRCGNLTYGRIYRQCPAHKNVVFLYDMRICSKCQVPSQDLEELSIDFETYQKLVRLNPTTSS